MSFAIFALFLLAVVRPSRGGFNVSITVFVSPTGNDSWSGTSSSTPLRSAAAVTAFVANQLAANPPGNVDLRVNFGNGTYADDECSWSFPSPMTPISSLSLVSQGLTTFNCSGGNATNVAVFSVSRWSFAAFVGLRFTGMRADCVGLPCAVLNVTGSATFVGLRSMIFDDNQLSCRNWSAPHPRVAPLSVEGNEVELMQSTFTDNVVTIHAPTVLPAASDRRVYAAAAATFLVQGTSLTIVNSTFSANTLVSRSAEELSLGGAVVVQVNDKSAHFQLIPKISLDTVSFRSNSLVGLGNLTGAALQVGDVAGSADGVLIVNNSEFVGNIVACANDVLQATVGGAAIADVGRLNGNHVVEPVVSAAITNTSFVRNEVYRLASQWIALDGGVVQARSLACTNCSFVDNYMRSATTVRGGLVRVAEQSSFRNTTVTGNRVHLYTVADSFGLMLHMGHPSHCDASPVSLVDVVFTNNSFERQVALTDFAAGASSLVYANLEECARGMRISSVLFANNSAALGACVAVFGGSALNITQTQFVNNSASSGGALSVRNLDALLLDSVTFHANNATDEGGAVLAVSTSSINMVACTFTANRAGQRGDAIVARSGGVDLSCADSEFLDNGVVLLHQGDAFYAFERCRFSAADLHVHACVRAFMSTASTFNRSRVEVWLDVDDMVSAARISALSSVFVDSPLAVLDDSMSASTSHSRPTELVQMRAHNSTFVTTSGSPDAAQFAVQSRIVQSSFFNASSFAGVGAGVGVRPLSLVTPSWQTGHTIILCSFVGTAAIESSGHVTLSHSSFVRAGALTLDAAGGRGPIARVLNVTIQGLRNGTDVLSCRGCTSLLVDGARLVDLQTVNGAPLACTGCGSVAVNDVEVRDCVAGGDSSMARFVDVAELLLANSTFARNEFALGCVFVTGDDATSMPLWQNVTIEHNRATVAGGAFFVDAALAANSSLESQNNTASCYANTGATTLTALLTAGVDAMIGNQPTLDVRLADAFGSLPSECVGGPMHAELDVQWAVADPLAGPLSGRLCTIAAWKGGCSGVLPLTRNVSGIALNVTLSVAVRSVAAAHAAVRFVECLPGSALLDSVCTECQKGTFAFGLGARSCEPCPSGVECAGGSAFATADAVFLAWSNDSRVDVELHECLPGVCRGGRVVHGTAIENDCVDGRDGLLCAACRNDSFVPIAPNADGQACLLCSGVNGTLVALMVLATFAVAVVLHVTANGEGAKMRLLLYYAQIAVVVLPPNFSSSAVLSAFNIRVAAATASFGGVCIANIDHIGLTLVKLLAPFAIWTALALLFLAANAIARVRRPARPAELEVLSDAADDGAPEPVVQPGDGFWSLSRFKRTSISIVLLTFSVVLKATLDLINCRQIGTAHVLSSDVRVSCDASTTYATWRNVALYALLPYVALVVIAVPVALVWARRRGGGALPRSLGVLHDVYRPHVAVWWEGGVLVRRVTLGVIDVLLVGEMQALRAFVINAVNVVVLVGTLQARPLKVEHENWLDALQLAWLLLIGTHLDALAQRGNVGVALFVAVPLVVIGGAIVLGFAATGWRFARRVVGGGRQAVLH